MAYLGNNNDTLAANEEAIYGPLVTDRADAITGAVFSDQGGTIFIEQSGDGENWDISTEYAVTAGDGRGFSESLFLPWVRIRYVNGGTNQGEFRLFSRFGSAGDS